MQQRSPRGRSGAQAGGRTQEQSQSRSSASEEASSSSGDSQRQQSDAQAQPRGKFGTGTGNFGTAQRTAGNNDGGSEKSSKGGPREQQIRPRQQQQTQPGLESQMRPRPEPRDQDQRGSGKLEGRVALITGGDSGIGRAVAIAFAREGASVAISYLNEHEDAEETRELCEQEGGECLLLPGDIKHAGFCQDMVRHVAQELGGLDIIVNNAAVQHPAESIEDIELDMLFETFETNIFAMFYITRAALPYLRRSRFPAIINTASVTAYRGNADLIDYAATKGAIVAFTRSLSQQLVKEGIRVNAVAPGPIWTPLIPATFDREKVSKFGSDVPMGRAGEPAEVAPAYVFLASADGSYVSGQVIHVNGGEIVNA